MELKQQPRPNVIVVAGIVLLLGLCLGGSLAIAGSGVGLWYLFGLNPGGEPTPRLRPTRQQAAAARTFTPTASPTPIPTATASPTLTSTSIPTATPPPTPTLLPPTPTAVPPTDTPPPMPAPPTPTPLPTDTPIPSYPFKVVETSQFPTNHLSFDVYVAITNADNRPVSGYRVLGTHSSGLQIDSQISAGDWTVNSGAMHYKAGNIKYEAPNSPAGVWTLQLVDEANNPVAPPVEFSFDGANPTWYFLLYRRPD